jgi:hypothetical protein
MTSALFTASLVFWALALLIGGIDGLYFHLWRFRLYAQPESRLEHLAHAARAVLVVPTLWVAFFADVGSRIAVLLTLIGADLAVAIWDVFLERRSRTAMGGMPHFEYFVHVAVTALHSAAEAVTVSALLVTGGPAPRGILSNMVLVAMLAVSVGAALLHLLLVLPRFSAPHVPRS